MIQKVYDTLKPLNIPALYMFRPEIDNSNKTGISYHFFNESDNLYGDGEGMEFGGSLQIDIFSLLSLSSLDHEKIVKKVRDLMKANKFRLADMRDSDDSFSNVEYYHKILIFNYIETEVLR